MSRNQFRRHPAMRACTTLLVPLLLVACDDDPVSTIAPGAARTNAQVAHVPVVVVRVDPRAGFLPTHDTDTRLPPVALNLASLGLSAGTEILIQSFGDFAYWPDDPNWDGVERNSEIIGIFTAGPSLATPVAAYLPSGQLAPSQRQATGYDSGNDIPFSFFAQGVRVIVPAGATHLYIGVPDRWYGDNVDRDRDFGIQVTRLSSPRQVKIRATSGNPFDLSVWPTAPAKQGVISELTLSVGVYSETGEPLPGQVVHLSLDFRDGFFDKGGHFHGGPRPLGTISPSATVSTGPTGIALVTYVAPEFSGRLRITGTSQNATADVQMITVMVPWLESLPHSSFYDHIGHTPEHPINHYGTADLIAALQQLAALFYAEYGKKLQFNDMSLPLGGRFDIDGDFADPEHNTHRWGWNADLRTITLDQKEHLDWIWATWRELGGTIVDETRTSRPHYHLIR